MKKVYIAVKIEAYLESFELVGCFNTYYKARKLCRELQLYDNGFYHYSVQSLNVE